MKTTTISAYTKEIKANLKEIKRALREIEECENILDDSMDWREYDKIQHKSQDATSIIMQSLEEMVEATTSIGISNGSYETHKCYKIKEV